MSNIILLSDVRNENLKQAAEQFDSANDEVFETLTEEVQDLNHDMVGVLETIARDMSSLLDVMQEQFRFDKEQADIADDPVMTPHEEKLEEKVEDTSWFDNLDPAMFLPAAGGLIGGLFSALGAGLLLASTGAFIKKALITGLGKILLPITGLFSMISGFIEDYFDEEGPTIEKLKAGFQGGLGKFVEFVSFGWIEKEEVEGALNTAGEVIGSTLFDFVQWVKGLSFDSAMEEIGDFGGLIAGKISEVYNDAISLLGKHFPAAATVLDKNIQDMVNFTEWLGDQMMSGYENARTFLSTELFPSLAAFPSEATNAISSGMKEFFWWISDAILEGMEKLTSKWVFPAIEAAVSFPGWLSDQMVQIYYQAVDNVSREYLPPVGDIISEAFNGIISFPTWLAGKMVDMYHGAVDFISREIFEEMSNAAGQAKNFVTSILPDFNVDYDGLISDILGRIGTVIADVLAGIAQQIYMFGRNSALIPDGLTDAMSRMFGEAGMGVGETLGAPAYSRFVVPSNADEAAMEAYIRPTFTPDSGQVLSRMSVESGNPAPVVIMDNRDQSITSSQVSRSTPNGSSPSVGTMIPDAMYSNRK